MSIEEWVVVKDLPHTCPGGSALRETPEKMSFKSIFSGVSVCSVANFFTYPRNLLCLNTLGKFEQDFDGIQ